MGGAGGAGGWVWRSRAGADKRAGRIVRAASNLQPRMWHEQRDTALWHAAPLRQLQSKVGLRLRGRAQESRAVALLDLRVIELELAREGSREGSSEGSHVREVQGLGWGWAVCIRGAPPVLSIVGGQCYAADSWCRGVVVSWYRGIVVSWYRGIMVRGRLEA